ncbi:hypothetical protein BT69DRAFT_1059862 [Atractiella rhizophila]|nr:hypothetical protein BT69DRAFT_1059862 [Atractiella rhizophila]
MFDLRYLLLLLSQCFGWCFMDADKLTDSLANLAPAEWNKDTSDEWTIVTRFRFTNIKSQLALCDLILQKLNEVGSAIKMTCSDESEKRRLQRVRNAFFYRRMDSRFRRIGGGIGQLFRIFKQLQSLFASCYVFWSTVQTNFHHIGSNIVQLTQTQLDAFSDNWADCQQSYERLSEYRFPGAVSQFRRDVFQPIPVFRQRDHTAKTYTCLRRTG